MSSDIQFVKTRANLIRHNFIEEMERHLLAFERALISRNIKVDWIIDEDGLTDTIFSTLPKAHYNRVCFDLDNIPEVLLNADKEIKVISPKDMENDSADLLVTQADFGIVENGSIILIDKKTSNAFNKVTDLIIILDIDKLLIKQCDLETILFLKYDTVSEENFPRDIKIINDTFYYVENESFIVGNEQSVKKQNVNIRVLLYDNGISTILENNVLREALYCINCGKCGKVCPVYKHTGKFTPINLVKYNSFDNNIKGKSIFGNTTLCGNCNEVCPVLIPLTDLLIEEMEIANSISPSGKMIDMSKLFSKRSRLNKVNNKLRRLLYIRKYFGKNKKLATYFKNQTEDFFNISHTSQEWKE